MKAALSALGVPQTGGYILYLCSNLPRPGSFTEQVAKLGGPRVVSVDVRVGGYSHDLSHASVADAVIAAASDSRCAGVLASIPCKTWSASRGVAAGGGLAFSQPLRDIDHPLGFTKQDGSLPVKVSVANRIADVAAAACEAVFHNTNPDAGFILEAPVARGKDSPFAIPGRESHIGVLDHPSIKALQTSVNGSVVNFDQCCTRDDPSQTPQKTTALLTSPNLTQAVQSRFGPLMCMHPVGTHPSMVGIDETGELRSTKWEQYSPRMNRLLSECFINASPPVCATCTPGTPLHAWESFFATDAERVETSPANATQWSALRQSAPFMGTDFSWNFFDSSIDGQCFAAPRERDCDNPSYTQAMNGNDAAEWTKACHAEIETLRRHEAADPVLEDTLPT